MVSKLTTAIDLPKLEEIHRVAATRAKAVKLPTADLSALLTAHHQLIKRLHDLGVEVF